MDAQGFQRACDRVLAGERDRQGIGTLGEKTLHAVLKEYFRQPQDQPEARVGPYVADLLGPGGIVEIQTRDFQRLRDKLAYFLPLYPVTVVYPVPARKWLVWLEADGTATPRRKSPKRAQACQVLPELSRVRPFLRHENLRLCVALLELEEYRLKNGWSRDGKRGSTRYERFPLALLGEVWVRGPGDYHCLLPANLPDPFTAREFSRAGGLSPKKTSFALGALGEVGTIARAGTRGRAYLYQRAAGREAGSL